MKKITLLTLIISMSALIGYSQTIDETNKNITGFNRIQTGNNDWLDIQLEGSGSVFKIHDNTNSNNWVRWTAGTNYTEFLDNIYLSSDSKLGIGTNDPGDSKLKITGSSPYFMFYLINDYVDANNFTRLARFQTATSTNRGLWVDVYNAGGTGEYLRLGSLGNIPLSILPSGGNVLIGKTTQQNSNYKLDVAGTIRANEIKVNLDGADFVFESNYKLKSLKEVESFIKENKRLPDIASAEEMSQEGADLGDLNTKLLQKIEELTLYIIEQNKKMEDLQNQINELKN